MKRKKIKRKVILIFSLLIMITISGFILKRLLDHGVVNADEKSNDRSSIEVVTTSESTMTPVSLPTELPQEGYAYDKPVPESDKQDVSFLDDAVFIGDSRVEGFIQNNSLANVKAFTHKGLNVNMVMLEPIVNLDGKMLSIMDAMRNTNFSKVYLMMGINEMGWVYSDIFFQKYGQIIDEIKAINPDADIYIQSILPVSNEVSSTHEYINNDKIIEFNQQLQQLVLEKQVYYLNIYEVMAQDDHSLPVDAAFDGIHLKKEYCEKWLDYLLSHTVVKEERHEEVIDGTN